MQPGTIHPIVLKGGFNQPYALDLFFTDLPHDKFLLCCNEIKDFKKYNNIILQQLQIVFIYDYFLLPSRCHSEVSREAEGLKGSA